MRHLERTRLLMRRLEEEVQKEPPLQRDALRAAYCQAIVNQDDTATPQDIYNILLGIDLPEATAKNVTKATYFGQSVKMHMEQWGPERYGIAAVHDLIPDSAVAVEHSLQQKIKQV